MRASGSRFVPNHVPAIKAIFAAVGDRLALFELGVDRVGKEVRYTPTVGANDRGRNLRIEVVVSGHARSIRRGAELPRRS